jgi:tetratricopeptide (TPR) repeat protein
MTNQATESYRYDAFISYRHVDPDRQWAKWLHQTIETYRVPKQILNQPGIKPLVHRVFRDEEELPVSSSLSREIDQALEQSRFLIVICSPKTPESQWCCAEIERFRAMGRDDQILALLVEGEPGESFPTPLRTIKRTVSEPDGTSREVVEDVEPLAADVRPSRTESQWQLKRAAKLRFVACMLGCRFDDLAQREQHRQNRRKTIAVTAMAALALVMTTLAVFAVIQADRARQAEVVAKQQRDVALETLDALIVEAYDKLQDRPGGRQLQDALLELALTKLKSVNLDIEADETDGRASRSAAIGMRRRGNLFLLAGRTEHAADLIGRSLVMLEELVEQNPTDRTLQRELARSAHLAGQLTQRQGNIRQAERHYQRAMQIRHELAAIAPNDLRIARDLGDSYEYVGDAMQSLGDTKAARSYYEKSLDVRSALAEKLPDDPDAKRDLATAHSKFGDVCRLIGDPSAARDHFEQSARLFKELAQADEYNTRAQRDLAVAYNKLGSVNRSTNDLHAAAADYRESLAITRKLAESDRGNLVWQQELALCFSNLGFVEMRLGEPAKAREDFEHALAIAESLADADPVNASLQRGLADAHQMVGGARKQLGELDAALQNYQQAVAIRRRLVTTDPDNAELKRELSIILALTGDLYHAQRHEDRSRRHYEQSLKIRLELAAANPANAQIQRDLSIAHMKLATALIGQDRVEQYEAALAIRRRLIELDPTEIGPRLDLGTVCHMLGVAQAATGDRRGPLALFAEAEAIFDQLVAEQPGDGNMLRRQIASCRALAQTQLANGDAAAAGRTKEKLNRLVEQLRSGRD